jgi:hypothetical protein
LGELTFDGSRGPAVIEVNLESPRQAAQILFALSDLFSNDIQVPSEIFHFSDEDRNKIETLFLSKFDHWWHSSDTLRHRMVENFQDYRRIEAARTQVDLKLNDAERARNIAKLPIDVRKNEIKEELKKLQVRRQSVLTNIRVNIRANFLESELEGLKDQEEKIMARWRSEESAARADAAAIDNDIRSLEKAKGSSYQNIVYGLQENQSFASPPGAGRGFPSTDDFRAVYLK